MALPVGTQHEVDKLYSATSVQMAPTSDYPQMQVAVHLAGVVDDTPILLTPIHPPESNPPSTAPSISAPVDLNAWGTEPSYRSAFDTQPPPFASEGLSTSTTSMQRLFGRTDVDDDLEMPGLIDVSPSQSDVEDEEEDDDSDWVQFNYNESDDGSDGSDGSDDDEGFFDIGTDPAMAQMTNTFQSFSLPSQGIVLGESVGQWTWASGNAEGNAGPALPAPAPIRRALRLDRVPVTAPASNT